MEQPGLTQFMLLLHQLPQLGEKSLLRILSLIRQQMLAPDNLLQFSVQDWVNRCEMPLPSAEYLCINREKLILRSAQDLMDIGRIPLHVLSIESLTYPKRLQKNAELPPPILYCAGRVSLLSETIPEDGSFTFTIAVSNGAEQNRLADQDMIAESLILQGGVVVTGHDRLPYQRLALSAQRLNRPAVYVLDRGLREALGTSFDRVPFAAARIRESKLNTERDAVVSSFRLDDHGLGTNNRRRDSLIFALSDLIVALDIRAGGGMAAECLRSHKQRGSVQVCEGGRDGNSLLVEMGCPIYNGANHLPIPGIY